MVLGRWVSTSLGARIAKRHPTFEVILGAIFIEKFGTDGGNGGNSIDGRRLQASQHERDRRERNGGQHLQTQMQTTRI